ncbi:hypothetical protein EDD11_004110 [Mortierella claussenii]|nr:hypothetical protein EDD11_004110 [Mortierella claussenii]
MSTLTPLTTLTMLPGSQDAEQSFQPSDFSFLSQLLHIIQKIEAGEDAQEIATLSSNLKTSFKKCQMILDHLPGADLSPDEQERILAEETQILKRKKAQLATYLSWKVFQHDSAETLIKKEVNNHDTPALHPSLSTTESKQIKSEHLEATPSLATDSSLLSDLSQESHSTQSSTGLTFALADVKMEDAQNTLM